MPKLKPQTRFLLRGSALMVGLLILWWFLLLNPMLWALKTAASPFLPMQENPSGDWTLQVALEKTLPATAEQPAQLIHSIDFDMPRGDVIAFTFSLPLFWALMLAAPGLRRNQRALVWGTALMSAVELAMLLVFAQIAARNAAAQLGGADDAAAKWARHLGEYLIVSVLPYVVPFAIALWLHEGLRTAMFSSLLKEAAPVEDRTHRGGAENTEKAQRRRRR
jgi:hypothetical protein